MSVNARVVPRDPPHKMKQEARGMQKINWPEMIARARKEKWAWQPPDDIPVNWEGPLMTVINKTTGERVPWYRLTSDQQMETCQRATTILEEAIKQQIKIIEMRSESGNRAGGREEDAGIYS